MLARGCNKMGGVGCLLGDPIQGGNWVRTEELGAC